MKKILFSLLLCILSTFSLDSFAQSRVYCELVGQQKFLSSKVTVQVDFGQQTTLFSDNRLVDENGDVVVFNSMVDAMNYMGGLGWEFEQAYVVTMGSGASSSNVYHWLLSKYVGDEQEMDSFEIVDMVQDRGQQAK